MSKYAQLADLFKPLFGMVAMGKDKKAGISLSQFLKEGGEVSEDHKEEIRKAYVFRRLMGMRNNNDGKLRVLFSNNRERYVIVSYNEKEPTMMAEKSRIPTKALEKWFDGDYERVRETLQEMIYEKLVDDLRKIIEETDPSYIGWLNIIRRNLTLISSS